MKFEGVFQKKVNNRFLFSGLILLVFIGFFFIYHSFDFESLRHSLENLRSNLGYEVMFILLLLYIVVLSVPYFPGLEVGIIIMCVFGEEGAVFTYLATILSLSLSFMYGKYAQKFGFLQSAVTSLTQHTGSLQESNAWIENKFLQRVKGFKLNPLLLLVLLINLPGNSILGGGGGIAFWYGFNQTLKFNQFLLYISLAVLPVPLMALLSWIQVDAFLS